MKKLLLSLGVAVVSASAVIAAETTVTETSTTTSTGVISEYQPGSTFILKEESGPVTYGYGDTVTYVTSGGETIEESAARTRIRAGVPVSVDYITDGDKRMINRVTIKEETGTAGGTSRTSSTTTTGTGTITQFTPGTTMIIKEESGPVTYGYGKSVTYVGTDGQTIEESVARTRIRAGVPVSVDYITEGDKRVVNRVTIKEEVTTR